MRDRIIDSFGEDLVPDVDGAVAVHNTPIEKVSDQTDDCVEFLLKPITDQDGRFVNRLDGGSRTPHERTKDWRAMPPSPSLFALA